MTAQNDPAHLTKLQQLISQHFNQEGLRNLCFALGIDYEEIGGSGKSAQVRELLLILVRTGRLPQLLHLVGEERPQVSWPPIPPNYTLQEANEDNGPVLTAEMPFYGRKVAWPWWAAGAAIILLLVALASDGLWGLFSPTPTNTPTVTNTPPIRVTVGETQTAVALTATALTLATQTAASPSASPTASVTASPSASPTETTIPLTATATEPTPTKTATPTFTPRPTTLVVPTATCTVVQIQVVPEGGNGRQVQFSWTGVPGAAYYRLYVEGDREDNAHAILKNWERIDETQYVIPNSGFVDTFFELGTDYMYILRAYSLQDGLLCQTSGTFFR